VVFAIKTFEFAPHTTPKVSLVIPVFNQQDIIARILNSLIENITLPTELLIIVDKSRDKSEEEVIRYFQAINQIHSPYFNPLVSAVKVIVASKPLFETRSDNVGFRMSRGDYIIEIQSDMLIQDRGFDKKMVAALEQNPDLFAVSGRAITSLSTVKNAEFQRRANIFGYVLGQISSQRLRRRRLLQDVTTSYPDFVDRIFPSKEVFQTTGLAGWRGGLIDEYARDPDLIPLEIRERDSVSLYLGEVIMRGPLCIRSKEIRQLGFLNESAFFLGYDEIDLSLRAWKELNKRVAFMPIYLLSPAEWGSTRKKRTFLERASILARFASHSFQFRKTITFKTISNPELLREMSNVLKKEIRMVNLDRVSSFHLSEEEINAKNNPK